MKCWNSAFNAQSSRLIIVVVQLGAVKTYVSAVELLRKKEIQDETQFTTKIDSFLSFIPRWMLMYFFAGFLLLSPFVWPNSGVLCLSYFTDSSNMWIGLSQKRKAPSKNKYKDSGDKQWTRACSQFFTYPDTYPLKPYIPYQFWSWSFIYLFILKFWSLPMSQIATK
jgi:hypothetical protein